MRIRRNEDLNTQLASSNHLALNQRLPFSQRKQQTDNEQLRYI